MNQPSMTRAGDRDRVITAAGIIAILIVGWLAYAPGLSGTFTFDDLPSLEQLQDVDDRVSAIRFTFTGKAGPLGRPIALASYLPQADAFEDGARPFLTVNVLLHLLNGVLVVVFLRMLAIAHGTSVADAGKLALLGAAIWLLMPVLASSSLIVIQRMTTLSATFVLLGLIGYLAARGSIDRQPERALIGMSLSLVVASVLAVFSKENGALLPTLVLIIEATLLSRPIASRSWSRWSAVFLWAPTALLAGYLLYRGFYTEGIASMRGFTGAERLMTEARILWEYLFRAIVPLPGIILPYNDGHPVARTLADPLTLLALTAWIAAIVFAIRYRRRYPIAAFAVSWFLAGHLLESTSLPLELVFDHRNYLPLIGPAFAIAWVPFALAREYRPLAFSSLVIYALMLAVSLYGATSRMGEPASSAAFWYDQAPSSVRAATSYATAQLGAGDVDAALATLRGFVAANPQHGYLLIQDLNLACLLDADGEHGDRVAHLVQALPEVGFSLTTGAMLNELLTTTSRIDCRSVGAGTVSALAAAVMQNPSYAANRIYAQFHHGLMANLYREQGDVGAALGHLREAAAIAPSMDTITMLVTSHVANADLPAAREVIRAARSDAPLHPARRFLWAHDLDELDRFVDSVEAGAAGTR